MRLDDWQFLIGFFGLKTLRLFMVWFALVPVAISSGATLPNAVDIQFLGADAKIQFYLSLPFSWWVLWIGSLSFTVAFSLYYWRCPNFVRRYPNFGAYESFHHSHRYIAWEAFYALDRPHAFCWNQSGRREDLINRILSKNLATEIAMDEYCNNRGYKPGIQQYIEKFENRTTLFFIANEIAYQLDAYEDNNPRPKSENDLFWEIFGNYSKSHPKIRFLIKWLVSAAFAALIVVVLQNILFVAEYLIERFCGAI